MFAIIQTGGKQYSVKAGDVIFIEKIDVNEGEVLGFDTLMISREGQDALIGSPSLGEKVKGKVLGNGKGEKILVYKYKSKKNERKMAGHRQPYTKVEIIEVV